MRGRFTGLNALWTRTDGVSALEFTAVMPVFLLLLFGAFEFAQVFWIWNTMELAAAQGGRYAMTHRPSSCNDSTYVQSVIDNTKTDANFPGMNKANFTVTAVPSWSCATTPPVVTVAIAVSYTYSFVASALLPFGPITLNRQANVTVGLNA